MACYAMAEPAGSVEMDPFGDTRVDDLPTEAVTVEILGVVAERAAIDQLLAGWEGAMDKGPDSIQWVRDRLAAR